MFCSSCGKQVEDGLATCPHCGASMTEGLKDPSPAAGAGTGPSPRRPEGDYRPRDGYREPRYEERSEMASCGVAINVLAAIIYWTGLIGSFSYGSNIVTSFWVLIPAGYVLIRERDNWLRAVALKALLLVVFFTMMSMLVCLVDNFGDLIWNFVKLVDSSYYGDWDGFNRFLDILRLILLVFRNAIFLIAGFMALGWGNLPVLGIDRMVSRSIGRLQGRK